MKYQDLGSVNNLRPWLDENGRSWLLDSVGSKPSSIQARLTKSQWLEADMRIVKRFRDYTPLFSWMCKNKLMVKPSANVMVFEEEGKFDPSKPPIREGVVFDSTPLPFIYHDFKTLDGDELEQSTKAVAVKVEEELVRALWTAAGSFTLDRITPTFFDMGKGGRYYGPFVVVGPQNLLPVLQDAYLHIEGIQDVIGSGVMRNGQIILFQATSDVVRVLLSIPPILVQWEDGWRVVCVASQQVRRSQDGVVGIAVRG